MAGPSIVVRVMGDLAGLGTAFEKAGSTAQSAAGRMSSAFKGTLGTLNQTGVLGPFGAALDGIGQALDNVAAHGKSIGPMMMGIGAGVAGVGVALQAMGSKDQAAHQQLQAAVTATGRDYDDYAKAVDAAIKKQENYGHTAAQTQDALRILTQAMGDPAKALQYLGTAADLAAAKHEDLSTAATQMGKAYNGATKILKDFGLTAGPKATIATKELESATKAAATADDNAQRAHQRLADVQAQLAGKTTLSASEQIRLRDAVQNAQQADGRAEEAHKKLAAAHDNVTAAASTQGTTMDQLSAKLRGQASAAADTFGGRMAAMRAKIEDTVAVFGQKWGPAITMAGVMITALGSILTAFGVTLATVFWPVTIVIGILAALVAIGVVLYKNWDTLVKFFQGPWGNAVLLAIAMLTPFIGIPLLIIRNWSALVDFFSAVWAGIVAGAEFLAGVVTAVWSGITAGAEFVAGVLVAIFQGVWTVIGPFFQLGGQLIQLVFAIIALQAKATADVIVFVFGLVMDAARFAAGVVAFLWTQAWTVIGPPLRVVGAIASEVFGGIVAAAQFAAGVIAFIFNGLVGVFQGIANTLRGVFSGMWNGIVDAFKWVLRQIIGLWNQLHFTLPHVDFLGVKVGGETIGVPPIDIPGLAAGGIVTGPTLALIGERGPEAVVPLGRGMGPAVHIDNVNLTDGADVDLLLSRIAFATTAGRL